jgi:FAD/FMN-containing dehydrogenase
MTTLDITTLDGSKQNIKREIADSLQAAMRGAVLKAGDAGYDEACIVWNGMFNKRPALIARCEGAADVIAAVNFAREHDILLAVRGGGHSVAGNSSCDDGLLIDLSRMKGVRVDPKAATVRVQGGATLGDMDRETQVFGIAAPAGVVSTTGVGGLTLGGGTGWQTRRRGLTIDNLLSVDIVTADGRLRVASASENADLFWAVRGGGGNFGVVTSFEYKAYPVGPTVLLCCPLFPFEDSGKVMRAFREFVRTAPDEFGAALLFWFIPENPYFPQEHHGKPVVIPIMVYIGDIAEGEKLARPIRELGTPLVDLSGPIPWTALQSMFDPFVPKRAQHYYWKNLYIKRTDDEVIEALIKIGASIPSKRTYLVWQPLGGGAMSKVGASDTAFGPRDMGYMFEFDSMWVDPAETEMNVAWTRKNWADLQRFSTGGLYINFPGLGEEGEKLVRSAVGDTNYDRLAKAKAQYDPGNLFRLNQNIKPANA